jgi:hypothetical protein
MKELIGNFGRFLRQYAIASIAWLLVTILVNRAVALWLIDPASIVSYSFLFSGLLMGVLTLFITALDSRENMRVKQVEESLKSVDKSVELGHAMRSLGIHTITSRWTDFVELRGQVGRGISERLENVNSPATWYIVTVSPEGMLRWMENLKNAVEKRGINVKWAYHSREALESNEGIKAQWEMMLSRIDRWQDRSGKMGLEHIDAKKKELHQWVQESQQRIQAMSRIDRMRAGSWELFESHIPHFYLAFLSVPGKHTGLRKTPEPAPDGTFGFVHLYPMFPLGYELRPALYLDTRGEILDYYYWSIVGLFDEGVKRDYVKRVWPLEAVAT